MTSNSPAQSQEFIQLLKLPSVQLQTGLGKTTIYRKIKAGTFPRPVRCGVKCVRWRLHDINNYIASLEVQQ